MSDILTEVLNDQNDEKKLYYFTRMLPITIVLVILVVLVMIINHWYNDIKTRNNQRTGDILINAMSLINDNKDLTLKSLEHLATTSDNKIKDIALLQQVSIKITDKDYDGAKTLLEDIIKNKNSRSLTISYACLVWLSLVIDEPDPSDGTKEKIQEYLKHFDDKSRAFFGIANVIKAIWFIKNDSTDSAKNILKNLLMLKHISPTIKEQAKILLSNLA